MYLHSSAEKDPKIINQRSKEFTEFISVIQKSVFLLTIAPVKFFCQVCYKYNEKLLIHEYEITSAFTMDANCILN